MLTDAQIAENELICEKLLGWEVRPRFGNNPCGLFFPDGRVANGPYSFTTWAEAGLILDALKAAGEKPRVFVRADEQWGCMGWHCGGVGSTAFAAIRAAALEYIKAVKS